MSAKRCPQLDWFPTHCAACLQAGRNIPATWLVTQGQGHRSYHACDEHRDLLEQHGTAALNRRFRRP